jgi:hypothetical protein
MKRAGLYTAVLLLPALSTLPIAQRLRAIAETDAVQHTIIAQSGGASPAGGTYLAFSFFNATLNARHQVAFDAVISGSPATTGVFAGDGQTTAAIALGINFDPTSPSFVSNPSIMSNGDVVFEVNGTDIFTGHGKSIVPLARDGDAAPGGGTLTPFAGTRGVNDQGAVAYVAGLNGTTASQGIFRSDGKETVTIARDDTSPPTGGSFTLFSNAAMNDRGQVTFFAEMNGGSADFGIFRGDGGDLTPVFVANQVAPGGATFADFGDPVINRHGQVAAFASLTNSTSRLGLFVGDGTDAVAIALEGQPAPSGGTYRDASGRDAFIGPLRLNDRGEVAFNARLAGSTSSNGIFRGNSERTTTIALAGTAAPGTTGEFQSFDDFKLGIDGRVAFIGTLALGVGGVNTSNNKGIWIGKSSEDLQLVVRTGDIVGGTVLTRLPQFGQGHQFDLNENDVLWVGNFGLAKAVVLSRIPGESNDADIPR